MAVSVVPLHPASRIDTHIAAEGWRFLAGDPPGAEAPDFDDHGWARVSVPHTWNAIDGSNGGGARNDPASGYRRGPGWYRRVLPITGPRDARRFFLRFEGASQVAEVFVNGQRIGRHAGAFTAFCFEVTAAIHPGSNLLAVRVDNAWTGDLAPLEGDFVVFGGLYRPVHLIETGALCIDPREYAGPGVYVTPTTVTNDHASFDVRLVLSDERTQGEDASLRLSVRDAAGDVVARADGPIASGATEWKAAVALQQPRLWDGRRDPYRYTMVADVICAGATTDHVEQAFGVRAFAFDAQRGFFLNGKPCRMLGVNRHQDRARRGWALSDDEHREDIRLITDMGANAVRLAHYPQADLVFDLCDENGLLVWAEIPLVNRMGASPVFAESTRQQLLELIHQQYNRAGIFAWGLWNELGMSPGPDPEEFVRSLQQLARAADPTRSTVAAGFNPSLKQYPAMIPITDQIAWNQYPGWYGGGPEGMGSIIDRLHAELPDRGLAISEYGAGASVQQHEQQLAAGPRPDGEWHPEEWQAFVHEVTWHEISRRPFVWGSFVWNMFDFASVWRSEGDAAGINDKGLVTYDRRTRKDAYFFYQAAWSENPVLYVTSRRHALREEAITPLKIYCNLERVEVRLNGILLPMESRDGVVCVWPRVALHPGVNRVEACAWTRDGRIIRDSCEWAFEPISAKRMPPAAEAAAEGVR